MTSGVDASCFNTAPRLPQNRIWSQWSCDYIQESFAEPRKSNSMIILRHFFFEERKYLFTFVLCVCPHVYIGTTCKPGANRERKGASEPLELEL